MKALVLYGPNDYRIENDWPLPRLPEGWALVKVSYAGICGSDIPRFFTTGSYHSPMIIGHEFSGVVAKSTPGRIAEGTPVAVLPIIPCGTCEGCLTTGQPFHCDHYQFIGSRNDGGFAEYCAVKEENLFPLAEGQDLKVGAMIELFAVGLHVVRRSGFKNGRSVVFGAGPIGLACAQWLRYLGSEVTVVDVREYSLGIAKSLGLNAAGFDELGDEKRFDFAYEASGATSALTRAALVTKDLGAVTVVGRNSGDTVFSSPVFEKLMRKELTLCGCWGYNLAGEEALMRSFLESLDVRPIISHLIPLEQVPDALEKVVQAKSEYCKIMIDLGA
jgi:L-iditol 2-dehydrogenase